MIYLDSSVALAFLFAERRRPAPEFWQASIQSSRLLEYEIRNRVHAYGHAEAAAGDLDGIVRQVLFLDLTPTVLSRALEPFPRPVRTLDGLHLATMDYLRAAGATVELASYDVQMLEAAEAMGFKAFDL